MSDGEEIVNIDVDHLKDDQPWDRRERRETETERLDRNWASLLQELRVVQTGVQLLTGFLLIMPFQPRFDLLDAAMRALYLATVACAVGSTVLLIAPVAMHRILFRQHRLRILVSGAHRCAYAGLLLLGLAMTGVTVLIFDVVAGTAGAIIAGAGAALSFTVLWLIIPLSIRLDTRAHRTNVALNAPLR